MKGETERRGQAERGTVDEGRGALSDSDMTERGREREKHIQSEELTNFWVSTNLPTLIKYLGRWGLVFLEIK